MVYIYCIEFENGKKYVGKTRNLKERWEQHRKGIACPSTATQNFNNAKFILEDIVLGTYIAEHEQKWIDKYGGINEDGVLLNRINAISKTKKNKNKTEKIFEAIDRVNEKKTKNKKIFGKIDRNEDLNGVVLKTFNRKTNGKI